MNLLETCERLVKLARKAGATEAEAYAERTRDASVRVRDSSSKRPPRGSACA
jgi:predicted Zn-dependent protease